MAEIVTLALRRDVLRRSIGVSVVVGTILNVINQGDVLLDWDAVSLTKCMLTYLVPFCVATYGAVAAMADHAAGK